MGDRMTALVLMMAIVIGQAEIEAYPFEKRGENNVFYIQTAEQLRKIQEMADLYLETGGKMGSLEFLTNPNMKYVLTSDINLPPDWAPIGNTNADPRFVFRGSFDGNGHKISGLEINNKSITNGLFGHTEDAHISNIVITNANLKLTGDYGVREFSAGMLAGEVVGGVIENISILNSKIESSAPGNNMGVIGGLLGKATGTCISNINIMDISLKDNGRHYLRCVGGLVGYLENCNVKNAAVTVGKVNSSAFNAGGMVGKAVGSEIIGSYVNMMDISGQHVVGGFVGLAQDSGLFLNCQSSAITSGDTAGGFVGVVNGTDFIAGKYAIQFANSKARGEVTGHGNTGGFAGSVAHAVIKNSSAYVDVKVVGEPAHTFSAGGFVGLLSGRGYVVNSYAYGDIDALLNPNGYIGGFVGEIANASLIERSYSTGLVKGGASTGGFVGVVSSVGAPNTISDSYTLSPFIKGDGCVGRFAGRLDFDGINGCYASLGAVVVSQESYAHVIPSAFGADGADF